MMKSPEEIKQLKSKLHFLRMAIPPFFFVLLLILLSRVLSVAPALCLSLLGAGASFVFLSLMLNKWAGL